MLTRLTLGHRSPAPKGCRRHGKTQPRLVTLSVDASDLLMITQSHGFERSICPQARYVSWTKSNNNQKAPLKVLNRSLGILSRTLELAVGVRDLVLLLAL